MNSPPAETTTLIFRKTSAASALSESGVEPSVRFLRQTLRLFIEFARLPNGNWKVIVPSKDETVLTQVIRQITQAGFENITEKMAMKPRVPPKVRLANMRVLIRLAGFAGLVIGVTLIIDHCGIIN